MVDIEFIRKRHFVDGWSIRKISQQLGLARQTVRKALASAEPPRYRLKSPRPGPVLDPYRDVILTWLEQDATAPRKQRHTARRIYQRLVEEYGFSGSESTVRRFVAQVRGRQAEPFLPLTAAWGQTAQVDWGEAVVMLGGRRTVAHSFVLRLRASGVIFAWASPTERLEALLEGHCRAFAWLGGVPRECIFDNAKTAVTKILAGPAREEHTLFASLRAHYLFDSASCRPGEAHEKGAVENGVGYVRRNALVPVPDVPDWEALNAHLLDWCERERQRRGEAWEQERAALRPLPDRPFRAARPHVVTVNKLSLVTFDRNRYSVPCEWVGRTLTLWAYTDRIEVTDGERVVAAHPRAYGRGETCLELAHYLAARPHVVTVNKLSLVTFDRNRYSVPCEWVGRTLTLWAYTDRIEVTDGERVVAAHPRAYGRGETCLELAHYLPALARKPRAATHLAVVPKLPPVYAQVQRILCSRRPDGYRQFAQILLLHREFPAAVVTEALEEAATQGLLDAQAVRQLILNRLARPVPEPVPVPERFAALRVRASDPARYDALLGGDRR